MIPTRLYFETKEAKRSDTSSKTNMWSRAVFPRKSAHKQISSGAPSD